MGSVRGIISTPWAFRMEMVVFMAAVMGVVSALSWEGRRVVMKPLAVRRASNREHLLLWFGTLMYH